MLDVVGLRAGYGETNVLFGVSLRVGAGEVVAILGRNGAGKSTTLKAVAGMVQRTAQTLAFDGQDVRALRPYRLARLGIAYVPEERRIFARMDVEENLRVTRSRKSSADAWPLERVYEFFPQLAVLRRRRGDLLSGGEQQMLCIARALRGSPRLLLLDEPSEGLAPKVVDMLAERICALRDGGMAVLLSEQNQPFARALSDRVYVLDKGEVQFDGTFASLAAQGDSVLRSFV
jgi:branched-chain amino acid transport system ATP-binding protein